MIPLEYIASPAAEGLDATWFDGHSVRSGPGTSAATWRFGMEHRELDGASQHGYRHTANRDSG